MSRQASKKFPVLLVFSLTITMPRPSGSGESNLKVLVISAAFPPMRVGEAPHAYHLAKNLSEQGVDVHVLTTEGNITALPLSFTVHPIMRDWSWTDLPRLIKFVKRCNPDAILLMYIHFTYNEHPMITFTPTILKSVLPSVPFVTQFENAIDIRRQKWSIPTRIVRKGLCFLCGRKDLDFEFGTLLRDSERIVVLSDHHRLKLAKHFADVNAKCVLIPAPPFFHIVPDEEGHLRQRGREILGVRQNDFVISYFGYIYPFKGVETLLRAFQIVSSKRSDARLVLIGGILARQYAHWPNYAQDIYALEKQLGISDKVTWTGEYAGDEVQASMYLRAADICVLPFDHGLYLNNSSFAAAAAHGLPIISTKGEMLEAPFVHEENVYLCARKKPDELAMAIEVLIDQPHFRKRLADGALQLAQEWFSWERAIERTIETVAS